MPNLLSDTSICFFTQRQIYKETRDVPNDLKGILDEETFEKARLYQLDKSNFGFWCGVWGQLESSVSIFLILFKRWS